LYPATVHDPLGPARMGNTRVRRCISSAVLERHASLSDDVLLG
jgi:hypothetical protein